MRREGRMHGSIVRVNRRQWGYGHGGEKLSSKPTNQSKSTQRPVTLQSSDNFGITVHQLPTQKAMGKTKGAFKAKNVDITRSQRVQDWRLHQRDQLAAAEDCDCSDADCEHWESGHKSAGGRGDDYDPEMEYAETEYTWDGDASRERARAEMVLPIESLLTMRKRKSARKALALGQQQHMALSSTGGADEDTEDVQLEGAGDSSGDEVESWWGLGFYDEEEVPDDWFLITEEEGFKA